MKVVIVNVSVVVGFLAPIQFDSLARHRHGSRVVWELGKEDAGLLRRAAKSW